MKLVRNICLLTLVLGILFVFTGCKNSKGQTFNEYLNEKYPYIEYRNSSLNFDADNRKIEIIDGYILDQGNSYEWIETENGYDLIIHFVSGVTENDE